jgi:hypothetical protein
MTTAYTSLLGLALPVTGELSGTWGDTVNDNITQYLDAAVAGTNTLSSDSDVTLVKTTNASLTGTSSQYAVLLWTAGGTATRTIIAPSASSGGRQFYIVVNKTSSTQSIKLCGAGPTTGVTITANNSAICAWNGSDFVQIGAGLINLATGVTGTLPVANGGTGSATLTANNVLLGNGTSALQAIAPSTSGNVLTSNGTTWASSAAPPSLGVGQTWQDVTSSRAANTTYTNNTGKPIMVNVYGNSGESRSATLTIGGVNVANTVFNGAGGGAATLSGIVPDGTSYIVSTGGAWSLAQWSELR